MTLHTICTDPSFVTKLSGKTRCQAHTPWKQNKVYGQQTVQCPGRSHVTVTRMQADISAFNSDFTKRVDMLEQVVLLVATIRCVHIRIR